MKAALLLAFVLSGCATLAGDPAKMTAEQLKEWVKDKNANLSCGVFNSPYGRGVMTYVVLDKAVVVNGSVTVDNECKVTVTNTLPTKEAKPEERVQLPRTGELNCYRSGTAIVCEPAK